MTDEYEINPLQKQELSDVGYDLATEMNVEGAFRASEIFAENGEEEKANELYGIGALTVTYWEETVKNITGKEIYFNESDSRWHDSVSHQYVKDPYVNIRMDETDFENAMIEKYG